MPYNNQIDERLDYFLRHESGKLIAVLTKIFGVENMTLAEDVVQDAIIEALRVWKEKGLPKEPTSWLFTVAKNRALNIVNREKYKRNYTSEVANLLQSEWTAEPALDHFFSEKEIVDDQLRMMFTCCHPALTSDSQVILTLKVICGFGASEIASAFMSNKETINKRLVRARKKMRQYKLPFVVPMGEELQPRVESILETLYLIFNEGYNASSGDRVIKHEVVEDAIRLTEILVNHAAITEKSNVYALLALMLLNASRFTARNGTDGGTITLEKQDRSKWDKELRDRGFVFFQKSKPHEYISKYHILATISAYHCAASSINKTNWEGILEQYDLLLKLEPTALVQLNKAVAVSRVYGAEEGVSFMEKWDKHPAFDNYHRYYMVMATLYSAAGNYLKAEKMWARALKLTSIKTEQKSIEQEINHCREKK